MNAREAFLQLVDQSNWPDDIQGDYFHGYNDAMQTVHQTIMDFWDELGAKELPKVEQPKETKPDEYKCGKCERASEGWHRCPYQADINDNCDPEYCHCCPDCQYECAMDI